MSANDELLEALSAIDPAALHGTPTAYNEWIACGMVLHDEGLPFEAWDSWSAQDQGGYPGTEALRRHWDSFGNYGGKPVTSGTIFHIAERFGYQHKPSPESQVMYGWDDVGVAQDLPAYYNREPSLPTQQHGQRADEYQLPTFTSLPPMMDITELDLEPPQMLAAQVQAMFSSGDSVNVVLDPTHMTGKDYSAQYLADNPSAVLEAVNAEKGAYICVNPTSHGRKNADVTSYQNVLVECDEIGLPRERQLELIRRLGLPCTCIIDSANKSIHAVVRVGAGDADEYKQRVRALYDYCKNNGLPVDENCKNPARLMRLAGAVRGEQVQRLISSKCGPTSWDDFVSLARSIADAQQPTQQAETQASGIVAHMIHTDMLTGENVRPAPPSLIENVLSVGSVMMIAAPSKAGKSWNLIGLAFALATGGRWMGYFKCRKSRVLYINAEISEDWLSQRLDIVKRSGRFGGNGFMTLTTRGDMAMDMEALRTSLISECPGMYDVIIIDPVYIFEDGPENDQETITRLMKNVGEICVKCSCSIIFSHHFAKGNPALKEAMDRAAGSGVFARYYDQGVTLTPLFVMDGTEPSEYLAREYGEEAVAYEFATTSRNYKKAGISSVIWSYPLFHADTLHVLDGCPLKGSDEAKRAKGSNSTSNKYAEARNQKDEATRRAIESCKAHGEDFTKRNVHKRLEKVCESMGIDYPGFNTFSTTWTRKGGPTHYRADTTRGNQLFPVDTEATDEDGKEPFLAPADDE